MAKHVDWRQQQSTAGGTPGSDTPRPPPPRSPVPAAETGTSDLPKPATPAATGSSRLHTIPASHSGGGQASSAIKYDALIRAIQRRDLEGGTDLVVAGNSATGVFEAPCYRFAPHGELAYFVALTRVASVGQRPSGRAANSRGHKPASADVLSGLSQCDARVIYLLFGTGSDVAIYWGVRAADRNRAVSTFEALKTCLIATYPDVALIDLKTQQEYAAVCARIASAQAAVVAVGNPSCQPAGGLALSSADRLIRALTGSQYVYMVEAEPVPSASLRNGLDAITQRISETHDQVRWSGIAATTSQEQESREHLDRLAQHYEQLLEKARRKMDAGTREGMWQSSVALLTNTEPQSRRASALLRALLAGKQSLPEPFKTMLLGNPKAAVELARTFRWPRWQRSAGEPVALHQSALQTPLCSGDLGRLMDLPRQEAPGFRVTLPRRFGLDVRPAVSACVEIGTVLSSAGPTSSMFTVPLKDMNRHALIVGLTGSGKTNTTLHLLDQLWTKHQIPFLVIEPAKAQYRHLLAAAGFEQLQIFAPGYRQIAPFRLNPFEFEPGVEPQAHIAHLYTVFNAAFVLYAPMPYVLERALYEVYEDHGWDLGAGAHPEADSQTGAAPELAFPTLTDLHSKVKEVIDRLGYDQKIRMDVTAGLQARVDSLRVGQKGQTFDCRRSVPSELLFNSPTVLELSHLGSDDEKAFFIGLLLMRLYEHRERKGDVSKLVHVTVIEEAHRLLSRVSTDTSSAETANVKGKAVESFCNMLAEIRSYGEGILVAEQIPGKLADDLIKNTNLKIMHRIVAADDRELMGGAMNLRGKQELAVTALDCGQAVVFAEGVEKPVLVRVPRFETSGLASDDDVQQAARRFVERNTGILRQYAGCLHCKGYPGCAQLSRAKTLAARPAAFDAVWGYLLSCRAETGAAVLAWPSLMESLVPNTVAGRLAPGDLAVLQWCVFTVAADRTMNKLRRRGTVSFAAIQTLLDCTAGVAEAARRGDRDRAGAQSPSLCCHLLETLRLPRGPNRGCSACEQPCLFGPLAASLSSESGLVRALRSSGKPESPHPQIKELLMQAASSVLYAPDPATARGLNLCLYCYVADRENYADPAGTALTLFPKVQLGPPCGTNGSCVDGPGGR